MSTIKIVTFAMMVLTFTGCVSTQTNTNVTSDAFANRLIADKVAVAADAQRDFAAIVSEDKAVLSRKQASFDTDEIDVDYIGKPQQLLQTVAYRYGYKYVEAGKRIDLRTINLRVQKIAPVDVLRDVGNQIDAGANLVLDKDSHTLRLVYKSLVDSANK